MLRGKGTTIAMTLWSREMTRRTQAVEVEGSVMSSQHVTVKTTVVEINQYGTRGTM